MGALKGITRVRRNGREVEGSVYLARLTVPDDIAGNLKRGMPSVAEALPPDDPRRALFISPTGRAKRELLESTGHTDPREAARVAAAIIGRWKAAIAALRRAGNPHDVASAKGRIERWRAHNVTTALAFGSIISMVGSRASLRASVDDLGLHLVRAGGDSEPAPLPEPAPGVSAAAAAWARGYFHALPSASRGVGVDFKTHRLLEKLAVIEENPERWREVEDFDAFLIGVAGNLVSEIRAAVRPTFARAWREVAEAEEAERRYAAMMVALLDSARTPLSAPMVAFEPRAGDRTVGELLDAYAKAKPSKDGVAPARVIREVLGADKAVRAVSRGDARRVLDFVPLIPANVGQQALYRGLTLTQAVERANSHDATVTPPKTKIKRISGTTAGHYINRAAMIWNWALKEDDGWADRNPFRGLANEFRDDDARDVRGFTNAELVRLFAHLAAHKTRNSYLFWVPALALNGARLSELCQLRVDDVRDDDGTPYLDIGLHDASGKRDPMKGVKNEGSIRRAPIHPVTLNAGFLDFVAHRRAAGGERLFADIKPYRQPTTDTWDWSHFPSRAFADAIDVAVSDDVALRFHSFRHGFRTRAEAAEVPEASIDEIAGWRPKSVGRAYGKRALEMLAGHLGRLDYGDLKL